MQKKTTLFVLLLVVIGLSGLGYAVTLRSVATGAEVSQGNARISEDRQPQNESTPTLVTVEPSKLTPGAPPSENIVPVSTPLDIPIGKTVGPLTEHAVPCKIGIGVDDTGSIVYVSPGFPIQEGRLFEKGDRLVSIGKVQQDFSAKDRVNSRTAGFWRMFGEIQQSCGLAQEIEVIVERGGKQISKLIAPTRGKSWDTTKVPVEPEPDAAIYL
jgi:hypothetical protein